MIAWPGHAQSYNGRMACAICDKRKGKRACPAKSAKICASCCGSQREVSIACPLDCKYLVEAREHELSRLEVGELPYSDIDPDDSFLRDHTLLLDVTGRALVDASLAVAGTTDIDVREALDALVQTYKTLSSGIYYDVKPASLFAQSIAKDVKEEIEEFREDETEQAGLTQTRDSEVMKTLVFWLQAATVRDNRRPKGRAFLGLLVDQFAVEPPSDSAELQLIVPGA